MELTSEIIDEIFLTGFATAQACIEEDMTDGEKTEKQYKMIILLKKRFGVV